MSDIWTARRCKFLILFLSGALLHFMCASGEVFTVEGQVTYYDGLFKDALRKHLTVDFKMTVDGCKWFVRTQSANGSDYEEASNDGETIYFLACFGKALAEERQKGKVLPGDNVAAGWIFKGDILHYSNAHEIAPVWLAFASACYLRGRTNNLVEPVITYGVSSGEYSYFGRFKQRAQWTLDEQWPHVPSRVVYFEDGLRRIPGHPELTKPGRPPFNQQYTNVIYQVLSFTNVNDLRLPARAVLNTYTPNENALQTTELKPFSRYEIVLTRASKGAEFSKFQPQMPGVTIISETRFPGVGAFSYKTREWRTEAEVLKMPTYKNMTTRHRTSESVRLLISALLALVLFSPLLFILRRMKRGEQ